MLHPYTIECRFEKTHAKKPHRKLIVSLFGEREEIRASFECAVNNNIKHNFTESLFNSTLSPRSKIEHWLRKTERLLINNADLVFSRSRGRRCHIAGWNSKVQSAYEQYLDTKGPFAKRRTKRRFLKVKNAERRAFEMRELYDWLDAIDSRQSHLLTK